MSKPFQLHEQPIMGFVGTVDPARAKKFYGETLELALVSEGPYALVFAARDTTLRIQIVDEVQAANYTVLGWRVPSIIEAVRGLQGAGVQFERYQSMEQDEWGVWTAPDGVKVAWFKDPDDNTLSISQH